MNFKIFSTFVGHFCPPGSGSESTDPIESGSNPDPQPCLVERQRRVDLHPRLYADGSLGGAVHLGYQQLLA